MKPETYLKQKRFFFRFLKENNVFLKYLKYIKRPEYYNFVQQDHPNWTFDNIAKRLGMSEMITALISWANTPEGSDFWYKLHKDFRKKFHEAFLNPQ